MSAYTFGFSEFTTWPWSFKKDLQHYTQQGADVIEVCEFKLAHNDYADALDAIPASGLAVGSVQAKVHSIFVDSMAGKPEDPEDRIAAIKETIALTAPHVPRGTPFIIITGIAPDGNIRKAVAQTVEGLKELGEWAAQRGVRIAFEPLSPVNIHTDTAVWGLDQGLEVVDAVSHPAVGLCLDTWNVWQTPSLEDVIHQCGKRIFVVQLSDWKTPRSTADRYILGEGEIPFDRIVRAIRRTGYGEAWIVELLSSFHLEGSLWKSDLDDVLRKNREAFERIWARSDPEADGSGTPLGAASRSA